MKRIITLVFVALLCGVDVNAQRPVGDTIAYGGGGEYWYDSAYTNGVCAYNKYMGRYSMYLDDLWVAYSQLLRNALFQNSQTTSWDEFYHQYPDLASYCTGRYIRGQEFTAASEELLVVGLAVCPTFVGEQALPQLNSYYFLDYVMTGDNWLHVVDTTIAGRLTEYVQLYTFESGTPQLLAEGGWRWEYPHRYMLFPNWYERGGLHFVPVLHEEDTIIAPLYEVMFDTAVLLDKPTFMLACTHNNNGAVWTDTCSDTIYSEPKLCFEHYPTVYSNCQKIPVGDGYHSDWIKYESHPWYNLNSNIMDYHDNYCEINIFPILDTLFGTPCAAVTGLDTAGVDSVWATLMWSADARQHDWEVWYRPTGDTVDGGAVVTVAVPTVTLTGLVPGTEYSVAVRGRCDIDNYSPWSDTLLFTTPRDTTQVIDTTNVDTTTTQGISRVGNLDLYTRIMPNPAGEVVNVLSSYRLESVAVYDLAGRLIMVQDAEGISAMVNVSALAQGTYIMAIHTLQGVATKRLVVRRN